MKSLALLALTALTLTATATAAAPQEDGALVGLHELRREGRLICMVGHFHVGTSSSQPSKKAAMMAAVQDWAGFTGLEYGNHWASWKNARNRTDSCEKTGNSWGCTVEARPCKPIVRGKR